MSESLNVRHEEEPVGEAVKIGKRGTVVIPADVRRRFGLKEGTLVLVESGPDGVLLRPAAVFPMETYSLEEKAAFILENAVDAVDYARAVEAVRKMGLDPKAVPHTSPVS